jgi:hypothetical protein
MEKAQRIVTFNLLFFLTLPACLLFSGAWAHAGEIDPVGTLFCVVSEGVECRPEGRNKPFDPETVGLPKKFLVDFSQEMILPDRESLVRQRTRIRWVGRVENRLVLAGAGEGVEGVDDGVGWSMSIERSDGRFVTTASGGRVGYVVFGACRAGRQ